MPQPPPFADVMKEVDQLLSALASVPDALPEERERNLMNAILTRLREARDTAVNTIPAAMTNLRTGLEELHADAERLKGEIEQQQSQLADLKAQAATAPVPTVSSPPPPQEPPIDPDLGRRLRDELLDRLAGPAEKPATPPRPGRDVWEDWQ